MQILYDWSHFTYSEFYLYIFTNISPFYHNILEVFKPTPVHFFTYFTLTAAATFSTYGRDGSAGLTPAIHLPISLARYDYDTKSTFVRWECHELKDKKKNYKSASTSKQLNEDLNCT
ncbi:hypothetical protein RF11_04576 [Thelohanellus kitauei]|uniref:Uncharacterized protein n=1 Tax=Thelohanellus kitauei TaxID=669202 RepID=A0A0C2NJF0_THEKT|nr:hypothetical protein RF11_04576 [Thelohanellus kitauei]